MKLVGERRAIATLVFAFYFVITLTNGWFAGGPIANVMFALAGVYGLAVFSLSAGYFWARWYSVGVGLFGVIMATVGMWQLGALEPIFVFIGATHASASLALWGDKMGEPFEGQQAWRDRYHMDDNAVQRLGRSVMRAGISLPFVLMYGLMPKPDSSSLVNLLVLALAGVGFAGLVRMRTWGILSLAAAGATVVLATLGSVVTAGASVGPISFAIPPLLLGAALLATAAPFARPMGRWIAAR